MSKHGTSETLSYCHATELSSGVLPATGLTEKISGYIQLTKPSIMPLVLITGAAGLGVTDIVKIHQARRHENKSTGWGLFAYSIICLLGLFAAMVLDKLANWLI
jgi:heme O synthase-like polyprenyltransferase